MRKKGLAALILSALLLLSACSTQPKAPETNSGKASGAEQTAQTPQNDASEETEAEWRYELKTQTTKDEATEEGGVLLAKTSYAYPELTAVCDAGEGREMPEKIRAVLDAFNNGIGDYMAQQPTAADLAQIANVQYSEMGSEYQQYFVPYSSETMVESECQTDDLMEVRMLASVYYGGAHGGASVKNFHFDLAAGEFVELADLTDKGGKLHDMIAQEIVNGIYERNETDWYFDGFAESIRNCDAYNISFGGDGMTVIFGEYEIAPYASGMPEFTIGYDKLSRFLNERGTRLLALPLETRILGDYYDASEMWYWFEGGVPLDYEDSRTATYETPAGSGEMPYQRVDIPGVSTMAELRARLATRFSEALINERLSNTVLFQELDGVLYGAAAGRGTDWTVESVDYTVELNAAEDGGRILADIHRREESDAGDDWVSTGKVDQVEFPFTLGENGAIFSAFPTIW